MALAILLLAVTVIEPSFQTLLVAAIGTAMLEQPSLPPASLTAIALPAVTVGAQEKHRPAFAGMTKPLSQNRFAVCRHASPQAALDNGTVRPFTQVPREVGGMAQTRSGDVVRLSGPHRPGWNQ